VSDHGLGTADNLFIAFKFNEASSSDCPPERKVTPGRAGTIVLERVLTVYMAISPAVALVGQACPGVIMFGLSISPSMRRCWLKSSFMTAVKTLSETSAHTSIL